MISMIIFEMENKNCFVLIEYTKYKISNHEKIICQHQLFGKIKFSSVSSLPLY